MKTDLGFGVTLEKRREGLFIESLTHERILTPKGGDYTLIKFKGGKK